MFENYKYAILVTHNNGTKCWYRNNQKLSKEQLMEFSLDFKPRIIFGRFTDKKINSKDHLTAYFNFYDYQKHKDIQCYDIDGKSVVEESMISGVLNKYYCGKDNKITYYVSFTDNDTDNPELNNTYRCLAADPCGILYFCGYSEFSAYHAIEDCEYARKLILQRYWKPKKEE